MKIFDALQTRVAPNIFTPLAVYDGRKNAFSLTKLSLGPTDSAKVNIVQITMFTLQLTFLCSVRHNSG